jgi:hypothetical protein
MKRVKLLASLIAVSVIVAIVLLMQLCFKPGAEEIPFLAEAAAKAQNFGQYVRSYRYEIHMLLPGPAAHAEYKGPEVFEEIKVTGARILTPDDRGYTHIESYFLSKDKQRLREVGCQEAVRIVDEGYIRDCDEPWPAEPDIRKPGQFYRQPAFQRYANILSRLQSVRELPGESLRGDAVRVFRGSYEDPNYGRQDVTVWIGRDDLLIRRIRASWDRYFMEEEYYDYNADIRILPPSR